MPTQDAASHGVCCLATSLSAWSLSTFEQTGSIQRYGSVTIVGAILVIISQGEHQDEALRIRSESGVVLTKIFRTC